MRVQAHHLELANAIFMPPPVYIGEGGNKQSGCDVCFSVLLSDSL